MPIPDDIPTPERDTWIRANRLPCEEEHVMEGEWHAFPIDHSWAPDGRYRRCECGEMESRVLHYSHIEAD